MPRQEGRKQRRHDDLATLDYIAEYQRTKQGRSPSQRHIYRALSMSTPSVAHASVARLVRSGFLTVTKADPGLAGEMTITEDGRDALQRWRMQQQVGARSVGETPAGLRGAA